MLWDYSRIMGEGKENWGQGLEVSKCIEGLARECLDMTRQVQIIL